MKLHAREITAVGRIFREEPRPNAIGIVTAIFSAG
jgi:hypothetical protein